LVAADLLADERVQNKAYLTEEMVSERPSIDDFLAKSFGVCLLHEGEIIGWCLSEYNCGPRCEIGIAVAEPFRRRGLATLMARAFIDQALTQGVYDIGWICWAGNRPSMATAEKLGLALVDERDVYWVT
jgi:RimJ/RimL family protein N-acetyltransferase